MHAHHNNVWEEQEVEERGGEANRGIKKEEGEAEPMTDGGAPSKT